MAEVLIFCHRSHTKSAVGIVSINYLSVLWRETDAAWLEFHVDMSGVCAAIKDGEGEPLVGFVKFVSRIEEMVRRSRGL